MNWAERANGVERVMRTGMINKKYFGNSALIAWLIFCLWAGMEILELYGQTMYNIGFPFVAYMIAWMVVIFFGRYAIEWVINKLWT